MSSGTSRWGKRRSRDPAALPVEGDPPGEGLVGAVGAVELHRARAVLKGQPQPAGRVVVQTEMKDPLPAAPHRAAVQAGVAPARYCLRPPPATCCRVQFL